MDESSTPSDPDVTKQSMAELAMKTYTMYFLVSAILMGLLLFIGVRKATKICCWQCIHGSKYSRDEKEDPRVPETLFRTPSVLNTLQSYYDKGRSAKSTVRSQAALSTAVQSESTSVAYVHTPDLEYSIPEDNARVQRYVDSPENTMEVPSEVDQVSNPPFESSMERLDIISEDGDDDDHDDDHDDNHDDEPSTLDRAITMSDDVTMEADSVALRRSKIEGTLERMGIVKDEDQSSTLTRRTSSDMGSFVQSRVSAIESNFGSDKQSKLDDVIEDQGVSTIQVNGFLSNEFHSSSEDNVNKSYVNGFTSNEFHSSSEDNVNKSHMNGFMSNELHSVSEDNVNQIHVEMSDIGYPQNSAITKYYSESEYSTTSDVAPLVTTNTLDSDSMSSTRRGRFKKNTSQPGGSSAPSYSSTSAKLSKRANKY